MYDKPVLGASASCCHPERVEHRLVVWVLSTAQPATSRLKASSTTQQNTLPSLVGCWVMSVIHS